jgi:hypothetical protein
MVHNWGLCACVRVHARMYIKFIDNVEARRMHLESMLHCTFDHCRGAHVNVVGWGAMVQKGRSRVRFPLTLLLFFSMYLNPSSRTMAMGSTQPLKEMSTRNLRSGKTRPVRKADNLTAINDQVVQKMWDPRRFTLLWASTACYSDSFIFVFNHRWFHLALMSITVYNSVFIKNIQFIAEDKTRFSTKAPFSQLPRTTRKTVDLSGLKMRFATEEMNTKNELSLFVLKRIFTSPP